MNKYLSVETPGGKIFVEIDEMESQFAQAAGVQDLERSFEGVLATLKKTAQTCKQTLEELEPEEINLSFGIKAGAQAGTAFFGLAGASGEGSINFTCKWIRKAQR